MPPHRATIQSTRNRRVMPQVPILHALTMRHLGTTKRPQLLLRCSHFPSEPNQRCIYSVPDPSQPQTSHVRHKLVYTADNGIPGIFLWIVSGVLTLPVLCLYFDPKCRPVVPNILAGIWGISSVCWLFGGPWRAERKKGTWLQWLRLTLPEKVKPEDYIELTGKDRARALSCMTNALEYEVKGWERVMYGPPVEKDEGEETFFDPYRAEMEHEENMRVMSMIKMVDRDLLNETVTREELQKPGGYMCPATRYFRIAKELLSHTFGPFQCCNGQV